MTSVVKRQVLHGFLGKPDDWSFLDHIIAHDLLADDCLVRDTLDSWAKWFNSKQTPSSSKILIGYSLGGRLALHALIQNSDLWNGAVIISTHPGLKSLLERQMRLEHDRQWAKRLITEPWDQLINDWNQQPVFASDQPLRLLESDFHRSKLYKAMTAWSLGTQQNLRLQIAKLKLPILWITGENDQKFQKLANGVTLSHPDSKFWIAPQVGHRVHCAHHENLVNRIKEFEESIC